MAPRRRPRKSRNVRLEIAVEHLTKEDWGFDEDTVRTVARELLQEYGGEDAWYFLEQDSYSLLVEKILEYQEGNVHDAIEGGPLQGGPPDEQALMIAEEPGAVVADEDVAQVESGGTGIDENLLAVEGAEEGDISAVQLLTGEGVEGNDKLVTDEEVEVGEKIPSLASPKDATSRGRVPCCGWIDDDDDDEVEAGEKIPSLASPKDATPRRRFPSCGWIDDDEEEVEAGEKILSLASPKDATPRRRFPCYGYIDDDEHEEPDDFILLGPPEQVSKASTIASRETCRKRSMWDLAPNE